MRAHRINGRVAARVPAPFAAAIMAMQLHDSDPRLLRSLSEEEWRELLPMMDRSRLTLPFAQEAHSRVPCWVRERLEGNLADTAQNWRHVRAAYREAAATLDTNGVDYVVLKGFAQAPDFVPHPELRRQCDIDFYVPRDQIASAVRCLQEIGYAPCYAEKSYHLADHVPTLLRFGAWKWRGDMYDPDTPPAIEVHFCFWNESVSSIAIPEVDEFWNRRRLRACENLKFPALHRVDHVGYFAMHILRDVFNEDSRANHVRELGVFLDKQVNNDAFWREWTSLHSPRLRSMQATAFSLAVAWFACNVSDTVQSEIDSLAPQVKAWIENCGCTPLEGQFRRTREGRLLQILFAETSEGRKKILWRAVVPDRLPGPAKIASQGTHPSSPAKRRLIFSYLAYPPYMVIRAWMNGGALLRFLAHACRLYASRGRAASFSRSDLRSAPGG
ncbi:MAG TPA: nucleotidyltransferase family protein [Terriglobales bacterium]|nr:nucleotidyltransferase family protein [Terriglobales bacterium]